jgi:DNA-binding response OmpR family regulator
MNLSTIKILKSTTALFAEDDVLAREEIGKILQHYFYKVYIASSGEEALEIFEKEKNINVIFADILMKKMNGLELIKNIREKGFKIPAIIITSEKSEELLMQAITLKLTGYILKPISFSALKESLEICAKELIENNLFKVCINQNVIFDSLNANLIIDKNIVKLSAKEYRFLQFATQNQNTLLTKEFIEEYIWEGEEMSEAALKNFLLRLRQKIGKNSIVTIKSIGFKLVMEEIEND